MESYYEFEITCEENIKDALIAELAEVHFEGFVEHDEGFSAFIPQSLYDQPEVDELFLRYHVNPEYIVMKTIGQQNWNAQWEADFEPITVLDQVIIKAPFHQVEKTYPFTLTIQPKNTFGTGHHETTQLVLELMLQTDFKQKTVFDYGCGTGVLGIMASRMGASDVYGIDIDEWSAENVGENLSLNDVTNFAFERGDLNIVNGKAFDVVLANINKNILLASFEKLSAQMKNGARLIISGFYESDLDDLRKGASSQGLQYQKHLVKNEWCAAILHKQ